MVINSKKTTLLKIKCWPSDYCNLKCPKYTFIESDIKSIKEGTEGNYTKNLWFKSLCSEIIHGNKITVQNLNIYLVHKNKWQMS